jgi:hypothetical protein
MSNFNYNVGGFKGKLTGKTYESAEAMRHYERLEAMRRRVPTEADGQTNFWTVCLLTRSVNWTSERARLSRRKPISCCPAQM